MVDVTEYYDIRLDVDDIDELLKNGHIGDIEVADGSYVAIVCEQGTLSDLMQEHYEQSFEDND